MTQVSKLHFLIHPGFQSDPDSESLASDYLDQIEYDSEGRADRAKERQEYIQMKQSDERWLKEKTEWEARSAPLLNSYIEKATKLTQSELLFVFLFNRKEDFKIDIAVGKSYTQVIRSLRKILGKRMIVLSNRWGIFEDDFEEFNENFLPVQETAGKSEEIAAIRGYKFKRDVDSEAFGEMGFGCVTHGANALNSANMLQKETRVMIKLTDLRDKSTQSIRSTIEALEDRGKYDCIIFDVEDR